MTENRDYSDLPADQQRASEEADRVAQEHAERMEREHESQMQRTDLNRNTDEAQESDTSKKSTSK